jgi:hypothetical protein
MKIIDIFNIDGKTLDEILETYIIVTLQSIIDKEKYNV